MAASTSTARRETSRLRPLVWVVPAVLIGLAAIVLGARWLRSLESVQQFLASYPGSSTLPAWAPVGFPAWVAVLHGLNVLFMLLIVRSGWQLRGKGRPAAFWKRNNNGLIRTPGQPVRIGLTLWWHLTLDALWVTCGVLFTILLFSTGQWVRIVPVHWDAIPNALSAALQYVSLQWPTEDGWTNYNALQLLTYFITVFVAAPLALLSGLRLSPGLARWWRPVDRRFTLGAARVLHVTVMVYFVAFTIVHVTLVLATGALRNLNHMFGLRDDTTWIGFAIFAASLVVMAAIWLLVRPALLRPVASLTGSVSR
jgi:Thiosulfate reductase cytochrome B subunit (membrane anchoring protein)